MAKKKTKKKAEPHYTEAYKCPACGYSYEETHYTDFSMRITSGDEMPEILKITATSSEGYTTTAIDAIYACPKCSTLTLRGMVYRTIG